MIPGAAGSGTGSFMMLSELKHDTIRLRSIVTMTNSGGSSWQLLEEFGRWPPLGDLRQALVTLPRGRLAAGRGASGARPPRHR